MGYNALSTRVSISTDDLTTPSVDRKYTLGFVAEIVDEDKTSLKKFMYVKAHAALTQYQPYQLGYAATVDGEVITAAPVTIGASGGVVVVPQVAFGSGEFGFVQIQGDAIAKIGAETYAVGDHLELLNAGAVSVVDGTSGATVLSLKSYAISKAAGTTAEDISVEMLNRNVQIAAA